MRGFFERYGQQFRLGFDREEQTFQEAPAADASNSDAVGGYVEGAEKEATATADPGQIELKRARVWRSQIRYFSGKLAMTRLPRAPR